MPQTPWYQLDWLWQLTGYSLATLGALLLIWSLFSDRAKGRRRCPKCWYDMAGIPTLRCPECGRQPKHERKLLKTRRHWRPAALALLSLALGIASLVTPDILRGNWPNLVPTWALALFSSNLPAPGTAFLANRFAGNPQAWSPRASPATQSTPNAFIQQFISSPNLRNRVLPLAAFAKPPWRERLWQEFESRGNSANLSSLGRWLTLWRAARGDTIRPLPTITATSLAWEETYGVWLARDYMNQCNNGSAIGPSLERLVRACYMIRRNPGGDCDLYCVSETTSGCIGAANTLWLRLTFDCEQLASPHPLTELERGDRISTISPTRSARQIGTLGTSASPISSLNIQVRLIAWPWSDPEGKTKVELLHTTVRLEVTQTP